MDIYGYLCSIYRYDFVPTTYVLPEDREALWKKEFDEGGRVRRGCLIVKPDSRAKGQGIGLVNDWAGLDKLHVIMMSIV